MLLLAVLPCLAFPAVPGGHPPEHRTWSGAELARLAGRVPPADGCLRLAPGEELRLLLSAPWAVTGIGTWWEGRLGPAALRLRSPGRPAGSWWPLREARDLAPEVAGAVGRAGPARVAGLVQPGGRPAPLVELRLRGPATLDSLTLVFLDVPPIPRGTAPAASPGTGYPRPPVWDRASWYADPPRCTPGYCPTTHVAVHHSASASDFTSTSWSQCAANVKAMQSYHMYSRGWCDVGYHYLVCPHGDIFEGRAGGDDVVGAHDGYNCGSMGVCLLGYFHPPPDQVPTPTMWAALAELTAWKCDQQGIDPLGSSWYAGYGGVVPDIYGHRDVSATACPGDNAYAGLPALRQEVDRRLQGGGWSLVLDNPQAAFAGTWATGSSAPDRYGVDYRWASTGTRRAVAWWQPDLPAAGLYRVDFWWSRGSNRNPASRVGLRVGGQTYVVVVDQQQPGGQWVPIGSWWLPGGTGTRIGLVNDGPPGYVVIADAIRLVRQ